MKPFLLLRVHDACRRLGRGGRALPMLLLAGALGLSGCVRHRTVEKTVVVDHVMDATLEQLLASLAAQDARIQTMNASINVVAATGGAHEGQVKEIPEVQGYLFLRRPGDLRMLMLAPVLRSRAVDMVSDGRNFKLLITVPTKPTKAIEGKDEYSVSAKNGLDNLRPYMVRDALLIPTAAPEQYVTMTTGARIMPPAEGRKYSTEEPDYDLLILKNKSDHVQQLVRAIHFGRTTLKPYQQDIYDDQGRIVTQVIYAKYQKFGEIEYPSSIVLTRPLDELKLTIDITKMVVNGKLDDEQFSLTFPESVVVTKM